MCIGVERDEIAFVAVAELDVDQALGGPRRGHSAPCCLPARARVRRVAHSRTAVPQVACASSIGFSALGFGLWTTLQLLDVISKRRRGNQTQL